MKAPRVPEHPQSLAERLTMYKRAERHLNVAETRYWLSQYRQLAEDAVHTLQSMSPPAGQETPRCPRKKMGEYNPLRCCRDNGHEGNCNFIVDGQYGGKS